MNTHIRDKLFEYSFQHCLEVSELRGAELAPACVLLSHGTLLDVVDQAGQQPSLVHLQAGDLTEQVLHAGVRVLELSGSDSDGILDSLSDQPVEGFIGAAALREPLSTHASFWMKKTSYMRCSQSHLARCSH